LDCTTVVPELSGSEFFGHERGAFTNAVASREGVFATADGGTLFLDEVGELSLPMQASLLRIVQERTYKPVGGNHWKRSDFRLVCATNRDLLAEESRGAFRRDFYFRIAGTHMRVPPLCERREDIPLLVEHFLRSLCPGGDAPTVDPLVRDYLQVREYPGNVRELRHLVARLVGRYVGQGPITVGHLPEEERPNLCETMTGDWRRHLKTAVRHAMLLGVTLREFSGGASQAAIETAINDEGGNLQRAAKRLGVTDRALQMRRAACRDVAS
jgi:transcriptional regulator with GAF, ATPase, and Fis domain